jgi:hypothetical protein
MNTENDQELFDPEDGIRLINSMVDRARSRIANDGFLFIFWGWLVVFCLVLQYFFLELKIEKWYYMWPFASLIGISVTAVFLIKKRIQEHTRTFVDIYLTYTWTGFFAVMAAALSFTSEFGTSAGYFFLMLLYSFAAFISGGLLKFRPMVAGSVITFALGIISPFCNIQTQTLLLAAGLGASHLVPGHILRSRYL